jgi:hypothetical protein
MPSVFDIEDEQCYNGVSRALKKFAKRTGEMFLSPMPEG